MQILITAEQSQSVYSIAFQEYFKNERNFNGNQLKTGEKAVSMLELVHAKGKDKDGVSQALAQFKGLLQEGIQELKDTKDRHNEAATILNPILDFMESIKTEQAGKTVIIKASWKGSALGTFITPFFGLRASSARRMPPPQSSAVRPAPSSGSCPGRVQSGPPPAP